MWFSVFLMNAIPIICLTFLSIHFEKWWIVLFALLFSVTCKTTKKGE